MNSILRKVYLRIQRPTTTEDGNKAPNRAAFPIAAAATAAEKELIKTPKE